MVDQFNAARRIEAAETQLTRAVASAAVAANSSDGAFLREIGGGVAAFLRPGSPLNKVIGAGFGAPIEPLELEEIEELLRAAGERARVELATVAPPEVSAALQARGYRFLGFENVLVRALSEAHAPALPIVNVRVERVAQNNADAWRRITIDASSASDETGQPVDQFSYEIIADAIADFLRVDGFDRYLAFIGDVPAGAASMCIHDRIALLSGSATLRELRLRGTQTALIAARLADARERGAELAVVTVAPESRSEANLMKRGFSRAYARAIWVRE